MRTNRIGAVSMAAAFLLAVAGCGGSSGPTSPAVVTPPPPTTFQLQGVVSESGSGRKLPGIKVEVVDGSNAGRLATTDASGAYRMTGLNLGGFTVKASGTGFNPASQPVTLTSDSTADFSLQTASPILAASIVPATISVSQSGDPEQPNQLLFTLTVYESNFADATVQSLYFRLVGADGDPAYWVCDTAWLQQYYAPLLVAGGGRKSFRMNLVYDGPVQAAVLDAAVYATDSRGQDYLVYANAQVDPRATPTAGAPAAAVRGRPVGTFPVRR